MCFEKDEWVCAFRGVRVDVCVGKRVVVCVRGVRVSVLRECVLGECVGVLGECWGNGRVS